ncbi:3-(cis-5,6-dihydroxycyclohexa-1,3-dien-1-yl)propanoate dehydrogenase [Natrinema gelatinilyticum]|uniref:3-(cis-5,6-dihydroxycyclohexa-1, 3-dien-1-yl)propanoate dehydrogenase n=1 Tax=Natrinema gelatinilyticum TaxID=2961571 RepID=UPI0020C400F6|nr:3-(cis-5,6-dihydroxycyclohexa-1,3-dien-1-yl)propanoate dehydrogenase [Natrinema gelatinilyticum]
MGWLEGKTALVTGGGAGIGRAVVDRYVEEGAQVGVLELVEERVDELNDEFEDVHAIQGDVSEWADNERAVAETVEEFGQLDVFVGNAGIFDDAIHMSDLTPDEIEAGFDELFRVNVLGYMLGAKAALPELLETEGSMVFTASYSSFYPATGGFLYTSSKHAVAGIIRQLAYELAPKIRVNGVGVGYSPTNLSGIDALGQESSSAVPEEIDKRYPLTISMPEEYAGYYVLLADERNSRASTGTIIEADSGLSIRGADEPAGGTDL